MFLRASHRLGSRRGRNSLPDRIRGRCGGGTAKLLAHNYRQQPRVGLDWETSIVELSELKTIPHNIAICKAQVDGVVTHLLENESYPLLAFFRRRHETATGEWLIGTYISRSKRRSGTTQLTRSKGV